MKYNAGDIIAISKPLVYVVNKENKGKVCDRCLKDGDGLKQCSKCQAMWYCSVECQRCDWQEFHKHECSIFLKLKHMQELILLANTQFRNTVRMCIKYQLDKDAGQRTYTMFDGKQRTINDLMSHYQHLLTDKIFMMSFSILTKMMNTHGIEVNMTTVIHRFGQLASNTLDISNELRLLKREDKNIAGGLFIEATVFDHSCRPNASYITDGLEMTIRAMRDIDTDTDNITINYSDKIMYPRDIRRGDLNRFWFYDCHCNSCMDPNYSDAASVEFVKCCDDISKLQEGKNYDELEKTFERIFHLIENALGHYSKTYTEFMIWLIQIKCNQISEDNEKRRIIEDTKMWTKFQLNLEKTHGTDHSLFKACSQFRSTMYKNV